MRSKSRSVKILRPGSHGQAESDETTGPKDPSHLGHGLITNDNEERQSRCSWVDPNALDTGQSLEACNQ